MDLAYFLNQRLAFIEYFYKKTVAHFEEIMRMIDAGEAPYIDERCPQDIEKPAYLEEWQYANTAITVTGATCLDLLQQALHVFLDQCMKEIGLGEYISRLGEMKQKGWLANYHLFFREHLQIDWIRYGVELKLLEQVILARNDFTHNADFLSMRSFQSSFHATKHPASAFIDSKRNQYGSRKTKLL